MKYIVFILFTVMTNAAAQLMLKQGMMSLGPISFEGVNPLAGAAVIPQARLYADAGFPQQRTCDACPARRTRPHHHRRRWGGQPLQGCAHERCSFRRLLCGLAEAGSAARPLIHVRFLGAHGWQHRPAAARRRGRGIDKIGMNRGYRMINCKVYSKHSCEFTKSFQLCITR